MTIQFSGLLLQMEYPSKTGDSSINMEAKLRKSSELALGEVKLNEQTVIADHVELREFLEKGTKSGSRVDSLSELLNRIVVEDIPKAIAKELQGQSTWDVLKTWNFAGKRAERVRVLENFVLNLFWVKEQINKPSQ